MVKRMIITALVLVLAVCGTCTAAYGAAVCTVHYYYTSSQNPEGVPAATTGTRSGAKWKIKPAGPSGTVYSKDKNGKVMTYTFDGWYTNINCLGKKYLPGRETTALVPASSAGGYSISLYGRWVYSESGGTTAQKKAAPAAPESASPAASENEPATSAPQEDVEEQGDEDVAGSDADSEEDAAKSEEEGEGEGEGEDAAESEEEDTEPVTVNDFDDKGRKEALADWKHLLIDTFFHVNGRKYSFAAPGKYWKNSIGEWTGQTGRNGDTQSCITLPTVSLKRTGIVSPACGNIWLSSNLASTPNGTVRRLKKTSPMLTISYPHKSLKHLAAKGGVRYGDILCRSGHTFVYMGKDSDGHPLIYESGTHRDIGHGTAVTWGHHAGGHANKLTGKINKQIKTSNAVGDKWRKGLISDDAFKGHRASGKNLNKPIHIVCSINTFKVRTSCTNGTITPGSTYMAGKKVVVTYASSEGKELDSIQVDGRNVDVSRYGSEYTFRRIASDHWISVVYK